MRSLFRGTFGTLNSQESLDRSVNKTGEALVVHIPVNAFGPYTRKDWEKSLGNFYDASTLKQLKNFMQTQIPILKSIAISDKGNSVRKTPNIVKSHATSSNDRTLLKSFACPLCMDPHCLFVL